MLCWPTHMRPQDNIQSLSSPTHLDRDLKSIFWTSTMLTFLGVREGVSLPCISKPSSPAHAEQKRKSTVQFNQPLQKLPKMVTALLNTPKKHA